jgi:hypothetical protein
MGVCEYLTLNDYQMTLILKLKTKPLNSDKGPLSTPQKWMSLVMQNRYVETAKKIWIWGKI